MTFILFPAYWREVLGAFQQLRGQNFAIWNHHNRIHTLLCMHGAPCDLACAVHTVCTGIAGSVWHTLVILDEDDKDGR